MATAEAWQHGGTTRRLAIGGVVGPVAFVTAWAVLGALCQDRVPVTLARVTGVAEAPIAGCWTIP